MLKWFKGLFDLNLSLYDPGRRIDTSACFIWHGSNYTYEKSCYPNYDREAPNWFVSGGDYSDLHIHLSYIKKKWEVTITIKGTRAEYTVGYFEALPKEVFPLVESLVLTCNEYFVARDTKRKEEALEKQRLVEEQLSGVLGLTSSIPAIRSVAENQQREEPDES